MSSAMNHFTTHLAMSNSSDAAIVGERDPSSYVNGMSATYRWDDSDDSDVPALAEEISPQPSLESIPSEGPPTGPQRRDGVTALEQYMALVVDGRRIFFQVIVSVEYQGRGVIVPHVQVVWADRSPPMVGRPTIIWGVFCSQLQSAMEREMRRAFEAENRID
ncbi:hypothetical protein C8Q76DRAFT_799659 [Earliella scabrosa]|nr:hypothetical protein C8Q76DRAFT_799659 [Earliella scabrosa]